jgi:hypothetical protein
MPPLPGEEEITAPVPGDTAVAGDAAHADATGPGAAGPGDRDYDSPGTVTRQQIGKLQTVYHAHLGYTKDERDLMLDATEEIIRRGLPGPNEGRTHNNLSFNEAKAVIGTLEMCGTRERLTALLRTGELPPEDGSDG